MNDGKFFSAGAVRIQRGLTLQAWHEMRSPWFLEVVVEVHTCQAEA